MRSIFFSINQNRASYQQNVMHISECIENSSFFNANRYNDLIKYKNRGKADEE